MRRFEREVTDPILIEEMLKYFHVVHLGLNDQDGIPYVVPMNYGFEMKDDKLYVYVHFAKKGHKVELIQSDPRVCLTFSMFHDFPDRKYKNHYHDYRSVIAKGRITIVDAQQDHETFETGYNLLYTCNQREIVPLESRATIPPIYIGVIVCEMENVTAKSEFPIRTKEDVPFLDVYQLPEDHTPFDIQDIIQKRRQEMDHKE